MRLGGRLAAAIDVLRDIQERHRPAAEALRDWGLSHRFAGAGDRGAIGNIVYDALRRRRMASWLLDDDTPRALAIGVLMLEWGYDPETLAAALKGDRFAPEPLGEAEYAILGRRLAEIAPEEVRSDLPSWCVDRFKQVFAADWVDEAAALAKRPPLDLRVNLLKADRAKVLAELKGTGAQPGDLVPEAIRIKPVEEGGRHPNVQAEPAFRKGWFEMQDQGSQLAARLTGAAPGMQVLDYCAGGGGKTLAMAASMSNRGQIFAHDADKTRLAPIFDRLGRAGVRNVQVIKPGDLTALEGRMQIVLVDAPCTGSGTWRRKPDAKWRLGERQLEARVAEQSDILEAACRHVAPGGRLVYVTCSVFAEENDGQIANFISGSDAFRLVDPAILWKEAAGVPIDRVRARLPAGLLMSSYRTGTDGFFVSVMECVG